MEVLRRYANHGHLRSQLAKALVIDQKRSAADHPVSPAPVRTRLPNGLHPEIVTAYQAGATSRELGVLYNCSKSVVERILHQAGIPMRNQPLTQDQIDEASRLHGAGESTYVIARRFGVVQSTVWRALNQRRSPEPGFE